ncbi:uncharacterized protein B0T15DRAFT_185986 [Chaetomium strumarium]|uniref:Uncharacterized protein n=1 Tax=Chaetomium strumarium TaxID=1170767 RepID=A0AAJ0GX05_9PEZI|nr:hypothetical protein B0T15DRAFT_185986 [Chaetomium strumarium]
MGDGDPRRQCPWLGYLSIYHLSSAIQSPRALQQRGKSSHKFFTGTGEFRPDIPLPDAVPLEERESSLEGESKEGFLAMMRKMLQWEPSKRSLAKELAEDESVMAYM